MSIPERTKLNTVIIVEDEPLAREAMVSIIGGQPRFEVLEACGSAEEALRSMVCRSPDLLFLDIELPGMNGIELLQELRENGIHTAVVFTTAFDKYAIQAFKLSAFDYLLKPINKLELLQTLERFLEQNKIKDYTVKLDLLLHHINPLKKLRFSTHNGFLMIDPDEVVYVQADWNYSEIFFGGEKREVVTMNLGKVAEMLPPGQFSRINRSVVINLNYLEKVNNLQRKCFLRKNGEEFVFHVPRHNLKGLLGKND